MTDKTVKILTQLKARGEEEFGCAAVAVRRSSAVR
jgi:hypothetical protein